jgi:glycosyltransferase involved in cell wall biosynthesis
MKIDFHLHSKYSKRPSQWLLQKIGCPESFTEPMQLYHIAKSRGMTHVTICDHNAIEGAMEIAHLPDTFISEEITTYFPEDGCKLHVLALNISEDQHQMIQKVRKNIFELVAYLQQEKIVNVVAHPLYAVNDRLTKDHFEKILLLFKNFELNGARNHRENECIKKVVNSLTEEILTALAEKHAIEPGFENPWRKRLFGGSDDHSSLNIARTYTQIEGATTPQAFFDHMDSCTARVEICPATPNTMAHNLYGIAYQFYRSRFNLGRFSDKDVLMRFLDRSLRIDLETEPGLISKLYYLWSYRRRKMIKAKAPVSDSLMALLRHETQKLILKNPDLIPSNDGEKPHFIDREEKWFDFVNQIADRVMLHFADHLMDHLLGANVFNVFQSIGSAGGLYTLLAPYFVAYTLYSRDRAFSDEILRTYAEKSDSDNQNQTSPRINVAHFTDTFYEVNGVALTLQQQVKMAIKNNKKLTIITCHPDKCQSVKGIHNFRPIGVYDLPEYPEQKVFYPPFLEMLRYCYDQGFNHIHVATPGPIGLAGLAIARILKLPVSGTYHTAIPQYAQNLTGDEVIEDIAWKYMLWFYEQMDTVYAPSQSTRKELVQKGVKADKVRVYPRGIDIELFNPAKSNGYFDKNHAEISMDGCLKLLYVGRVSKEKNLHLLLEAFKGLVKANPKVVLIVTGDGPYLEEMQVKAKGLPCLFTGYVRGEKLADLYAACELFVFPSTTDTFGNVVLEAQASGLPVIVTDKGGPRENLVPGKTGIVVKADDKGGLFRAMHDLCCDPERLTQMGRSARRYMENRSFDRAFIQTWEMYKDHGHVRQAWVQAKAG